MSSDEISANCPKRVIGIKILNPIPAGRVGILWCSKFICHTCGRPGRNRVKEASLLEQPFSTSAMSFFILIFKKNKKCKSFGYNCKSKWPARYFYFLFLIPNSQHLTLLNITKPIQRWISYEKLHLGLHTMTS